MCVHFAPTYVKCFVQVLEFGEDYATWWLDIADEQELASQFIVLTSLKFSKEKKSNQNNQEKFS
jgi:hypothetical protein